MKATGLVLFIYIVFIIIVAIVYKISQFYTPENFIVATPLINSFFLTLLYISFYARRNKGKDLTKFMKPANDTLLFTSAALVSFNVFANEFSLKPFEQINFFLIKNPEIYIFIQILLVTAAFVKAFIAFIESVKEF
ncbi:hypothetical protein [Pectobacterium aroidearum]|uniref:hypothetical protein n=1 Tax=Pectobacterium aroidearum TaxID=1201031 RepID=UPI0021141E4A|nr:hypothetical protein [Pectobacterium aroidearum]UUE58997.1 hypothetical protein L0Y27_06880 [Pectobacterium aroidearum]UUE71824.1 hypothetical protein L0Y21_07550 [Pectobacterium aroidearum]UUE76224.1 hypothetical protein L0Y20_07655 [Pectobacterium aroidearum]UUE80449.1 hypothetical protein L0Y24_07095 [Pectobacterium aroidearum]